MALVSFNIVRARLATREVLPRALSGESSGQNIGGGHKCNREPCPALPPNWDIILECSLYRLVGKPNGQVLWPPFALRAQSCHRTAASEGRGPYNETVQEMGLMLAPQRLPQPLDGIKST